MRLAHRLRHRHAPPSARRPAALPPSGRARAPGRWGGPCPAPNPPPPHSYPLPTRHERSRCHATGSVPPPPTSAPAVCTCAPTGTAPAHVVRPPSPPSPPPLTLRLPSAAPAEWWRQAGGWVVDVATAGIGDGPACGGALHHCHHSSFPPLLASLSPFSPMRSCLASALPPPPPITPPPCPCSVPLSPPPPPCHAAHLTGCVFMPWP